MDTATQQFITEQMSTLGSQIEGLGKRLDAVEAGLTLRIEDVSKRLDAAEGRLGSQIGEMDERLERVEKFSSDTYDIVSGRLGAVEDKVGIRFVAPEIAEE